ncbi:iron-containing alcohol dehydrogenase family protein [Clostridium thermarum]|uniref:iron-containing alcohol dehydrogenase family protein n=1 Tax=Clostridium thermarum TaxID=1716543 RepID=UPI0013D86448|nr:iron-containing alcohol dehydrogenase family protein [Clostridium thermarum]
MSSLKENNLDLFSMQEIDDVDINEIIHHAFSLSKEAEAIIGIGGVRFLMLLNIWLFEENSLLSLCQLLPPMIAFQALTLPL